MGQMDHRCSPVMMGRRSQIRRTGHRWSMGQTRRSDLSHRSHRSSPIHLKGRSSYLDHSQYPHRPRHSSIEKIRRLQERAQLKFEMTTF